MVNVDIDKDLYEDIKKTVKGNKFDYPSIKFFVQKAIFHEIGNSNKKMASGIEVMISKIKSYIGDDEKLREKIDEVYNKEVEKFRREALR